MAEEEKDCWALRTEQSRESALNGGGRSEAHLSDHTWWQASRWLWPLEPVGVDGVTRGRAVPCAG